MAGATGPWDACWKPFRVYRQLSSPARIGFEACGNTQWFEDMLDRLGHEVWMGDAAEIRASYVRKQKTDRRDAAHILSPLPECRPACGDGRTALQHLMLNRGVQMKRKLWSEAGQKALRALPLEGWAAQRRHDLLNLLSGLDPQIRQLDQAIERAENARLADK